MRKNLTILALLFLCFSSGTFGEIKTSPINPQYMDYLKNPEKYSGIIPSMSTPVYRKLPEYLKTMEFPIVFDLHDSGWVTPIKDQGLCGACWAFASIAAIESNWLKNGYGEYDLSENNLKNGINITSGACGGGNLYRATGYFANALGPVLEIDDPYHPYDDGYIPLQSEYYINEAHFMLPQYVYSENELPQYINSIKESILNHGAHYTSYVDDKSKYKKINGVMTYYHPEELQTANHGVTIVGWNDTITTEAPEKGAWIIKNSWGVNNPYTDYGYFYISFYDKNVNYQVGCWPTRITRSKNNYIYTHNENGGYLYFGDGIHTSGYALMKAELWNQNIHQIGTWSTFDSNFEIEIYDDFFDGQLQTLLSTGSSGDIRYQGFYTVDLDSTIEIKGKNEIYIKVKYTTSPEYSKYIIPVELEFEGTTAHIVSEITSGNEWLSFDGINWDNSKDADADLCIKVIGDYIGLQPDFNVSKNNPIPNQSIQFFDKTNGNEATTSWLWNFGNGTTSTEENPFHTYENDGIYNVSLTVSSDQFTEVITKENFIIVNSANLLSPLKNMTIKQLQPTFSWDSFSFRDSIEYTLKIADDFELTKNVKTFTTDATEYTMKENLTDNTIYYWNIEVSDDKFTIAYNDTSSFIVNVVDELPSDFSLKLPKNGTTNLSTKVGFVWEESVDNDPLDFVLYNLKIDTTINFSSPIYIIDSITTAHHILSDELSNNKKYFWQVIAFDNTGLSTASSIDSFTVGSITSINNDLLPRYFNLSQNFPNPFNPTTNIHYSILEKSNVELSIYNTLGEKIETLVNSNQNIGSYQITWRANAYPSGLYFYVLKCQSDNGNLQYHDMKKMLLIK